MLWSASMFAAFFMSGLYLQLVLRYSPLEVGLAFLPTNILMAAFSLGLSARIVMRYGNRGPIVVGLATITIGLAAVRAARRPTPRSSIDVLPGFVLQGLGAGIALNPLLMAAMGAGRPRGIRPRLRARQHRLHAGRRARPRRPREPRGRADRRARRYAGIGRRQRRSTAAITRPSSSAAAFAFVATLVGLAIAGRSAKAAELRPVLRRMSRNSWHLMFRHASEVVRAGLRLLEDHETSVAEHSAALRRQIDAAVDDPRPSLTADELFGRLEQRHADAMKAAKHGA